MRDERLDPDALALANYAVFKIKEGEILAVLLHLGLRLGFWSALADGPGTAAELADRTDTVERWTEEWLHAVASAGLVRRERHDDGSVTYGLTPEYAAILARPDHPSYSAGIFGPPTEITNVERLLEGFHTGLGFGWGEHGPAVAEMQAQFSGARHREYLVDPTLRAMGDLAERLEAGAVVYDVGCGSGHPASAVARAFPASTVNGLDPSRPAIARAVEIGAGLDNLRFAEGTFEDLPADGSVDVVLTIDVMHDLAHPELAAKRVAAALGDDGIWVVADIKAGDRYEDNRANPLLPLFYGMSVMYCLNSSLSEPDGAGLGTMGLTPSTLERLAGDAGLGSIVRHEFDHDVSNYWYEIRP